jgi:hypothetical protein
MTTSTASATASTASSSTGDQIERGTGPSLIDETVRALSGYYGRLAGIGVDLVRVLLPVDQVRDAASRLPIEVTRSLGDRRRGMGDSVGGSTPATSARSAPVQSPESPVLLVEADGDRPGFGVFVVENLTGEPVSAPIRVSTFVDEGGRQVQPRLVLRPATVSLGPGEQALVQLAAELDDALESGVRYRGEIAIPALSDRRIPIVLRRRAASAEPPTAEPPIAKSPGKTKAKPRRRRATPSPDDAR